MKNELKCHICGTQLADVKKWYHYVRGKEGHYICIPCKDEYHSNRLLTKTLTNGIMGEDKEMK